MAPFFDDEILKAEGLEIESIVEQDPVGKERDWVSDRGVEDVAGRKRWLVVGVLRRIQAGKEKNDGL